MFTTRWQTSPPSYEVRFDENVSVPMSDGIALDVDVFRPTASGRFPALIGVHPYDKRSQYTPSVPQQIGALNASAESGDPTFYVRRGYAHVIANVRGTGCSGGTYQYYGPREIDDIVELIEWAAEQTVVRWQRRYDGRFVLRCGR